VLTGPHPGGCFWTVGIQIARQHLDTASGEERHEGLPADCEAEAATTWSEQPPPARPRR